jgi:GTP-binding protein HflX
MYSLPRLAHINKTFSRQRGGAFGAKGAGETQLELDQRKVRERIAAVKKELAEIELNRKTQRKQRDKLPSVALVGYTNAGKSSLLNALTGSETFVENKLFATLDPLARQLNINGVDMVLTDTVGFVRKLPHSLVEAFKSTLEEATLADFLLLVLDISSSQLDIEWETTLSVLKELGADSKKIQIVFNKCDNINMEEDSILLARLKSLFPDALYISCATNYNIDKLKDRLVQLASINREIIKVLLPPNRHDLVALVHASGQIFEEEYQDNGNINLVFTIETRHLSKFEPYIIS